MEQVEVVDRDCERVDRAEHDSRKRNTPKIKLTEVSKKRISKKVIDLLYAPAKKTEKKLGELDSKIEETKKKQEESIERQGIMGLITFATLEFVQKALIRKKANLANKFDRESRRAAALQKELEKNIPDRFIANLNNVDVNEIDRNSISEAVEKAFESMPKNDNNSQTINEPEKNIEVTESDTIANDDSLNSVMENGIVPEFEKPRDRNTDEKDDEYNEYLKKFYSPEPEFKTNYNESGLIEGTYRLKKDEIVQDDLTFKNDFVAEKTNVESEFKAPTIIPEFQQFFDSIPKFDSISEQEKKVETDSMSIVNDNSNDNTVNEEIFSKINDSLNDENITSSDLAKLREELETERNKKNKLTEVLEEKMKRAAVIEKETAAALQEQKEKMKLVRDELAAYKEENKKLETQAQQVEESTQRQISIRQQSLNYINSLNEMMGSRAVNVKNTKESGKGM